jgi:hypothetical protein
VREKCVQCGYKKCDSGNRGAATATEQIVLLSMWIGLAVIVLMNIVTGSVLIYRISK